MVMHLVRKITLLTYMVGVLFATGAGSPALAQRASGQPSWTKLLPETTVALVQIADIHELVDNVWSAGNFESLLSDEQILPLIDVINEQGNIVFSEFQGEAGLSMEELLSIPEGRCALAVIAPRRGTPEILLVAEVNDQNSAVEKALNQIREIVKETDQQSFEGIETEVFSIKNKKLYLVRQHGLIAVCTSGEELAAFFQRFIGKQTPKVRSLARNRKFASVMHYAQDNQQTEAEILYFLDPITLFKSARKEGLDAQVALKTLPLMGLDGLLAIGGNCSFTDDQYRFISRNQLLLAKPKKGVLQMINLKPDAYKVEPWVSKNAHWYLTTSWDMTEMVSELEKVVDKVFEEGTFEQFVQELNADFDRDLRSDVDQLLDGRVTYTSIMTEPGLLNGAAHAVSLGIKDRDEVEKILVELLSALNPGEVPVIQTHNGFDFFCLDSGTPAEREQFRQWQREELEDPENENDFALSTRLPSPSAGIVGDYLIVTDSVKAMQCIIDTHLGQQESLENDIGFEQFSDEILKLLGNQTPCAIGYNQPHFQIKALLDWLNSKDLKAALKRRTKRTKRRHNELDPENPQGTPFLDAAGKIMDAGIVADAKLLQKYIKPTGGFVVANEKGYQFIWFQKN